MASVAGSAKSDVKDEVKTLYYRDQNGNLTRSNDYKTVADMEELLAVIALKLSYSRKDLLGMYVHEFQAMVLGLRKMMEKND